MDTRTPHSQTPLFHSPGEMAKALFPDAPLLRRWLMRWRDSICPLEPLVQAIPKNASLLDIGCGGGLLALYLLSRRQVSCIIGVDTSESALTVARAGSEKLSALMQDTGEAQFLAAPHPTDWPAGPFDAVSMVDLMHHIPSAVQQDFFQAALERLRPGGVLVYKDMAARPRWRAAVNRLHDLLLARQWIHYCPIQHIEQWAQEAGLEMIASQNYARLAYAHELRVFQKSAE